MLLRRGDSGWERVCRLGDDEQEHEAEKDNPNPEQRGTTYGSAAMLPPAERALICRFPEYARVGGVLKPTFFGHYWLSGAPALQSNQAVCLDYSADGEQDLSPDHFVWVA